MTLKLDSSCIWVKFQPSRAYGLSCMPLIFLRQRAKGRHLLRSLPCVIYHSIILLPSLCSSPVNSQSIQLSIPRASSQILRLRLHRYTNRTFSKCWQVVLYYDHFSSMLNVAVSCLSSAVLHVPRMLQWCRMICCGPRLAHLECPRDVSFLLQTSFRYWLQMIQPWFLLHLSWPPHSVWLSTSATRDGESL